MTNEVDAYIAAAPKVAQPQLKLLRAMIREEAPKATEKMSYGIPFYEYGAKPNTLASRLIYFAAQKNHIAVYPASGAKGLDEYITERATLRFPLDKPLPMAKLRAFVRSCVKANAEKAKLAAPASRRAPKPR